MEIRDLLTVMVERDASDLYLTNECPPMYRIEGVTQAVNDQMLSPDVLNELANSIMSAKQKLEFEETFEMNLALAYDSLGRFRVNLYRQRGHIAIVIRQIKSYPLSSRTSRSPRRVWSLSWVVLAQENPPPWQQ